MAICDQCNELEGKSKSVKPHLNQEEISKVSHRSGMASGAVYTYKCRVCGTKMCRDTDKNDDFSTWWIDK